MFQLLSVQLLISPQGWPATPLLSLLHCFSIQKQRLKINLFFKKHQAQME